MFKEYVNLFEIAIPPAMFANLITVSILILLSYNNDIIEITVSPAPDTFTGYFGTV